jgi:hypothetical protein
MVQAVPTGLLTDGRAPDTDLVKISTALMRELHEPVLRHLDA